MRRMLADSKSHALAENFAFQWLNLRAIREFVPDPIVFPNFDSQPEGRLCARIGSVHPQHHR